MFDLIGKVFVTKVMKEVGVVKDRIGLRINVMRVRVVIAMSICMVLDMFPRWY